MYRVEKRAEFQPGDVISRPKGIVLRHYGIVLLNGCVLHNTPSEGEHASTASEFAAGHEPRLHPVRGEMRAWVLHNASAVLANPRGYDLFVNNCEHTVTRILTGEPSSSQLQACTTILASVGVIWLLSKGSRG